MHSSGQRSRLRAVALPTEHGGWGLTLEPVLLGLLVGPSVAGLLLGVGAFLLFLVRTTAKLVAVDAFRGRWLPRTTLAAAVAAVELAAIVAVVVVATHRAGGSWAWPLLGALPFAAVESAYEVRSRGRRLVPELCGAISISAVATAIALADGQSVRLSVALWLILVARAAGAIPFVRVQIQRLRRGQASLVGSDVGQGVALGIGAAGVLVAPAVAGGLAAVGACAVAHGRWVRRPPVPARVVGMREMVLGLVVVALTAISAIAFR